MDFYFLKPNLIDFETILVDFGAQKSASCCPPGGASRSGPWAAQLSQNFDLSTDPRRRAIAAVRNQSSHVPTFTALAEL